MRVALTVAGREPTGPGTRGRGRWATAGGAAREAAPPGGPRQEQELPPASHVQAELPRPLPLPCVAQTLLARASERVVLQVEVLQCRVLGYRLDERRAALGADHVALEVEVLERGVGHEHQREGFRAVVRDLVPRQVEARHRDLSHLQHLGDDDGVDVRVLLRVPLELLLLPQLADGQLVTVELDGRERLVRRHQLRHPPRLRRCQRHPSEVELLRAREEVLLKRNLDALDIDLLVHVGLTD
mmetsp:Transcript_35296/g.60458  ORF Transcript_35296/g.60458 Transcript_35296/m.60458 type:complete len:242 (+) Transcript_35296:167-892(+)